MPITLYELCGADRDRLFSANCWRPKMVLHHKGLDYETVPTRFTDKELIAFSGQKTVPVLVDGDTVVSDSWAISEYLEDTYPDRPSVFGDARGKALARFAHNWGASSVNPLIIRIILVDIFDHLDPADRAYFRETREKRFGKPLEAVVADREASVVTLRGALGPLRETLRAQPFLSGETAAYADYAVFGGFQWARSVSDFKLLESDDPVYAWRDRMLGLFDGLAAATPGYPL